MEKNELTLRAQPRQAQPQALSFMTLFSLWLEQSLPITKLAAFYSYWLEEEVTPKQTVAYCYTQLAAVGFFLPCAIGLGWRAFFAVLFCLAWKRTQTK